MTHVHSLWLTLGVAVALAACAERPLAKAPDSLTAPGPNQDEARRLNPSEVPDTNDPRIGAHKPSDDTRINSGAGNAEPASK